MFFVCLVPPTKSDAFAKGIVSIDFMKDAYKYMRQNAFDTPSYDDYVDGKGRRALGNYTKYGYVPLDDPVLDAFHHGEQVHTHTHTTHTHTYIYI